MQTYLLDAFLVVLGYVAGSVPFGLIVVKLTTGKDIRAVESGRTGGTNAMRAAGFWAGLATALLDIFKAAVVVWLASALGASQWVLVAAPVASILGHNYSIFLPDRNEQGRLRLRGGAGGAPAVGGAVGLWWPSIFIIVPAGALVLFGIGYASLTTMSVALIATIIFIVRAYYGLSPWMYVVYGILAEILLIWALRPNIRRLLNGTERLVGWRAKRKEKQAQQSGS